MLLCILLSREPQAGALRGAYPGTLYSQAEQGCSSQCWAGCSCSNASLGYHWLHTLFFSLALVPGPKRVLWGCANLPCYCYKMTFELHHQHPSCSICRYASIISCQEVLSGASSLGMICGFPQLKLLDFPDGRATALIDATAGWWALVAMRGGKVPQSKQWRPLFLYSLAGFRHKRALRGKEQYQGMWPVLIIVANLVIFGMFLKTWLLEAGD